MKHLFTILFYAVLLIVAAVSRPSDERSNEAVERLNQLRALMKEENVQAYIIIMSDAHQSERVNDADNRIKYLTNFTGSFGEAIVTESEALFWTDSRYHQQADTQIDLSCWKIMKSGLLDVPTPQNWLATNLNVDNARIGYDPELVASTKFDAFTSALVGKTLQLVALEHNLVDKAWQNRPPTAKNKIFPLELQFAGIGIQEKIKQVRSKLEESKATAIIIPTLDSIAWLLNLRGTDIPYTPVFFSYMIITQTDIFLYIEKDRLTDEIQKHLTSNEITIQQRNYEDIYGDISKLVNETTDSLIVVEKPASQAIVQNIPKERVRLHDLVAQIKCIKNEVEAKGMEQAHIRDGYALIRYLHWLNDTIDKHHVSEYSGAQKLSSFRSEGEHFQGLSFDVISGFGSNAALPHYTPDPETAKHITRDEIYLIDSGGQYLDGTTDVTRTMHFGTPTDFEMDCFTRVLKGFIALGTSVFPPTTPMNYLDYVARRPLWQVGLNYGHGTGHGVGSFLHVHEYPPSIGGAGIVKPNMFTSNEPGFYLDGKFGIRIEDVIQVVDSDIESAFFDKGLLTFKTITYAPIQTKMIKTSLLNMEEMNYVNNFNRKVIDTIGPILLKNNLKDTYEWLLTDTAPISLW